MVEFMSDQAFRSNPRGPGVDGRLLQGLWRPPGKAACCLELAQGPHMW